MKRRALRAAFATIAFGIGSLAIGCGGGTTGLEKVDGNVPPPAVDVAAEADVGTKPDASSPDVVIDATAEPTIDISVRPDSAPPDDEEDAGPRSDGQRMRDGVVVRDGIIIDPTNDASTTIDAAREAGGPATVCGDGKKEGKEECDDGNTVSGDGCTGICTDMRVCEACMATNCPGNYMPEIWPLCANVPGTAKNGEGAGRLRKDLCHEVYSCVLRTNCMNWATSLVTPCYCGTAAAEECLKPGQANGACKVEIENGVESIDPKVIVDTFIYPVNATGAALLARMCAHDLCPDECSPDAVRDGGASDAGGVDGPQDAPSNQGDSAPDSNQLDGTGPQDTSNTQ